MTRKPKIPTHNHNIDFDKEFKLLGEKLPEISDWWVAMDHIYITLQDINHPIAKDSEFTISSKCEICSKPTTKLLVIAFFSPEDSSFIKKDVSEFCDTCLYESMSSALTEMTNPEYFDNDIKGEDAEDTEALLLYLTSERIDFLQTKINDVIVKEEAEQEQE